MAGPELPDSMMIPVAAPSCICFVSRDPFFLKKKKKKKPRRSLGQQRAIEHYAPYQHRQQKC
jgi:hypothetical protein